MQRKLLFFLVLPLLGLSACGGGSNSSSSGSTQSPVDSVTVSPSPISVPPANTKQNWGQQVRDTINHEIDAQAHDTSLWCYRKLQEKDGKQQLFAACQAKGAEIDRLVAVNGKVLDEKKRDAEDQRIESLLKSQGQLKKQAQRQHEDAQQSTTFLKLIPAAFVFQMEGREGDQIKLTFTPNPQFRPSGHEAQVFQHMEGTLVMDLKQKRLAEISGRLNSSVKFGGGLLGHLDKGGTFLVKQQEVGSGHWEMTTLDVQMKGKALFFKTLAVREKEIDSEFQAVPQSATIQQAAAMTKDRKTEVPVRESRLQMNRITNPVELVSR
jgi:hypothetical protein